MTSNVIPTLECKVVCALSVTAMTLCVCVCVCGAFELRMFEESNALASFYRLRGSTWHCQPFSHVCRPHYRSPHPKHRVLLEQSKNELKRMRGCLSDHVPSYLDEFMWLERHGQTPQQAWINIMREISPAVPCITTVTTYYS